MQSDKNESDFIEIARNVSLESPCHRSKVGAVIVRFNKIITVGFNRAPINQEDCSEIGNCYRDENKIVSGTEPQKCRAFGSHAEANAIADAARKGFSTDNATMFIHGNTEVCLACRSLIANAGIKMVIYESKFNEIEHIDVLYDWGINLLDQRIRFENWKANLKKYYNNGLFIKSSAELQGIKSCDNCGANKDCSEIRESPCIRWRPQIQGDEMGENETKYKYKIASTGISACTNEEVKIEEIVEMIEKMFENKDIEINIYENINEIWAIKKTIHKNAKENNPICPKCNMEMILDKNVENYACPECDYRSGD